MGEAIGSVKGPALDLASPGLWMVTALVGLAAVALAARPRPAPAPEREPSPAPAPSAPAPVAPARVQEALAVAAARAAEIRIVHAAAHHFNTPLTPMRLQVHLLRTERLGALSDRQRRAVETLERNLDRLQAVAKASLDLAQADAPSPVPAREWVDLSRILSEAGASFEPLASERDIALHTSPEGESLGTRGDARRLTMALFALVDHALRATPRGGHVALHARAEGGSVVVQVRDSGPGIAPEDLPLLFRPFAGTDVSFPATAPGGTLPLCLAKTIVEAHGGLLHCDSPGPGQGTAFTFLVPLVPPPRPPAPLSSAAPASPVPTGLLEPMA